MGNAIKELEKYLLSVDKRLTAIDDGLKKQMEEVVTSIKDTITSEFNLI
jgi:hypothetical protein